ncbi:enoyl-CoA hydratase-related protein [Acinetobacter shaoyimingii]|uniref:Enoyl-CoA hydratase n=1 Tax=Acinetobacter shaoyimingii TaxID=2715164 RepID=A0A6G8RUF6_9GAMM|nr:enoyl-CoA hydratase-related protein [Acinetobacter shaoyimingii]QIO05521.1 enoyl-CoA hydratase [Acinetobacter shaoyimingii]
MLTCINTPYPYLDIKLSNGILTVTINRPEAKNALNIELYQNLSSIFIEADQSPDVRILLLKGNEHDFCAGNDMKSFLQLPQLPEAGQAGNTPPFILLKTVAQFTKPCIAAVRGVCIGVANTLLLHFDLVYADDSAIFQMPFVSLGLSLEGAASQLLVQRAGYHLAAELLFTAKKYDAETAFRAGIINAIVENPYTYADEQAQQLAALPLASLKAVKSLMKHNLEQILKCIDDEAEVVMQRAQSPEMFEAVSAFLQKRKPDFSQFN